MTNLPSHSRLLPVVPLCMLVGSLMAAFGVENEGGQGLARPDQPPDLHLNDIQVVGSHNSYKAPISSPLMAIVEQRSPEAARALDYSHPSLQEQLNLGLRSLEIDVYHDPEGGRYATPEGLRLVEETGNSPPAYDPQGQMQEPGFKVLHVPGIDFRSRCLTLKVCLGQIRQWSEANPNHIPLIVTMEAKDEDGNRPAFTPPLPYDSTAFEALDEAIRAVLPDNELILPDDVRGDFDSLEAAVLSAGWPPLEGMRGKVMFVLDEGGRKLDAYRAGHPSLRGRVLFVSAAPGTPEAAFHIINDPLAQGDSIRTLVRKGYMVRTRADANTQEARTGSTRRREAAFASGAQVVTTDYYRPDPDFGTGYAVSIPSGVARCNSISAPSGCRPDMLGE